jgi:hypothetical protein
MKKREVRSEGKRTDEPMKGMSDTSLGATPSLLFENRRWVPLGASHSQRNPKYEASILSGGK